MTPLNQQRGAKPTNSLTAHLYALQLDTEPGKDVENVAWYFQRHGGLICCESLTGYLRRVDSQPLSKLARWIVSRGIVTLPWRGRTFVPLFQFTQSDWRVHAGVTQVLGELRDVMDDGELAAWYATPNVWLNQRVPLTCVGSDDEVLLHAARVDRYVACG